MEASCSLQSELGPVLIDFLHLAVSDQNETSEVERFERIGFGSIPYRTIQFYNERKRSLASGREIEVLKLPIGDCQLPQSESAIPRVGL